MPLLLGFPIWAWLAGGAVAGVGIGLLARTALAFFTTDSGDVVAKLNEKIPQEMEMLRSRYRFTDGMLESIVGNWRYYIVAAANPLRVDSYQQLSYNIGKGMNISIEGVRAFLILANTAIKWTDVPEYEYLRGELGPGERFDLATLGLLNPDTRTDLTEIAEEGNQYYGTGVKASDAIGTLVKVAGFGIGAYLLVNVLNLIPRKSK